MTVESLAIETVILAADQVFFQPYMYFSLSSGSDPVIYLYMGLCGPLGHLTLVFIGPAV